MLLELVMLVKMEENHMDIGGNTFPKMNRFQTELTEELVNSLPQEVQDQLFDIINNVEFVKRLISPTREYAKDRPRDDRGRIIVDLANPHILENMDYFRPSAIHYEKYGTFTNLRPNANPNSEYGKWVREERRRIWDGYVRESDGEWVTGYMYWFLNYSPMMLSKIREYKDKNGKKRKSKRADRVEALPECWEGIYWRFHCLDQASNGGLYNNFEGGQHMAELASRGKGKSYSLASILNHIFVVGENEEAHEKVKGIVTAYQKEYLTKDGVLNKFVDMANFCATNTQFPRKRLKNSLQEMTWIMGYKDVELDIERGTQNTVLGVSSKDDESKLRGKRAAKILIEEFGTFPRLVDLYNVLLPSVQEGDIVFGQIYMLGTAGDNESDFAGAQEIMYNPKGYNMYALPNVFDKYNQGKPYFVFFFPGYVNRKGCYNENGVSDVIKALIEILMNRYRVKYNSTDPNTIIKTIAEVPITPAEAIVKTGVNMFPIADLTERIGQLDANPTEYDDVYVGDLVFNKDGQIEYKPTSATPIRDFPHKDNKIEGAIEIYQLPEIDRNTGKPYNDRYILGADPYDDDESNTMSLGSIFVLDLWTDRIVAEYTGRPPFADDYYEICRKLCLFYNGRMNYEYNKKGLFSHFSTRNSLYLLTDVLEFLKEKQMMKDGYGNKSKGTNASPAINAYARSRLRSWLLAPVPIMQTIDGEEKEVMVPRLFTVRNRALLKELINYNSEGNFDRISAMGMLMLLREDRMIRYQGDVSKEKQERANNSYDGNDLFFKRNYDFRFSQ
nr:MAG TPA: Terminase large subunit [Crassvirales sp.]